MYEWKPSYVIVLWILSMCTFVCVCVCVCECVCVCAHRFITLDLPCRLSLPSTAPSFSRFNILLCWLSRPSIWTSLHPYSGCNWRICDTMLHCYTAGFPPIQYNPFVHYMYMSWWCYIVLCYCAVAAAAYVFPCEKSTAGIVIVVTHTHARTPKMWCILPTFFKFATVRNYFHVRYIYDEKASAIKHNRWN